MIRAAKAIAKRVIGRKGRAKLRAATKSKIGAAIAAGRAAVGAGKFAVEKTGTGAGIAAGGIAAYSLAKKEQKAQKVSIEVSGSRIKKVKRSKGAK